MKKELKELKQLTNMVVERINAMSNKEVSYSNVHFLFKRNETLKIFAIACINTLEEKGIDSRDLSIAFSNTFCDYERCLDLDDESLLEDGDYIIDAPQILIERAMLWLTEQVLTDSSFEVRCCLPQAALESNLAFNEFVRGNKKK